MAKGDIMQTISCNPDVLPCAYNLLKYLASVGEKGSHTGQHTSTMDMEEQCHIRRVTGKGPALLKYFCAAHAHGALADLRNAPGCGIQPSLGDHAG